MTFDDELRDALRPSDPGPRFAERVLARLEPVAAVVPVEPAVVPAPVREHPRRPFRWVPLGLAASVTVATAAGVVFLEAQRRAEGERARHQVIVALRLTSGELNEIGRRLDTRATPTETVPGDPGRSEERVP
jgi:negative regulator of sigma E activity